jgi:hypothetical protein
VIGPNVKSFSDSAHLHIPFFFPVIFASFRGILFVERRDLGIAQIPHRAVRPTTSTKIAKVQNRYINYPNKKG